MDRIMKTSIALLSIFITSSVLANGGPFVLKYPNGDPAAKGVLARLDPDLKPGRETRLRVIKEDLKVTFNRDQGISATETPLAHVSAEYTIENPTDNEVEVDFGFPILRGVYIDPYSMILRPGVIVRLDKKHIPSTIISNSAIYGIIRQRARQVIEKAIADNAELNRLVDSVRNAESKTREADRKALLSYLTGAIKWSEHDAALMVEYASLNFGKLRAFPPDRSRMGWGLPDVEFNKLMNTNLGSLAAIGEQKATQFFAQLASCFDPRAAAAYEAIFTAWGGDVRERSVDLETGKVRPREVTVNNQLLDNNRPSMVNDPTIYARVDYLDPKAKITESEKTSCKAILKNLPVIFTFAPMNILHYRVNFPAKSTQKLTVSYSQYAFADTKRPSSYQLAYVVHPASLWKEFGPINLEVAVPDGVGFRASVLCSNGGVSNISVGRHNQKKWPCNIYTAVVKEKTGELYFAVDASQWKRSVKKMALSDLKNMGQVIAKQTKQEAR